MQMLTVFTRGSVWQNAWNFSEGKTGVGRVDVRGVGWLVLIAVGLATIEPHSGEQAGE